MTTDPMPPKYGTLVRNALTLVGFLAILFLLAAGQIAATFLIMLPLAFVIFGKRQDLRRRRTEDQPSQSLEC